MESHSAALMIMYDIRVFDMLLIAAVECYKIIVHMIYSWTIFCFQASQYAIITGLSLKNVIADSMESFWFIRVNCYQNDELQFNTFYWAV